MLSTFKIIGMASSGLVTSSSYLTMMTFSGCDLDKVRASSRSIS